jgi:hypothetical protein
MIKRKKRANNPRDTVVVQCLQGKGSTVLALSRTLGAGSVDAAAFVAASLTAAARGALPGDPERQRPSQAFLEGGINPAPSPPKF